MIGVDDSVRAVTCGHYGHLTSVPDIAGGPVRLTTPVPRDEALTLEGYWRWRNATDADSAAS